jgi:4-amino-4-deoxy-L-arabinose transferase-like glycosyltransferase
MGRLRLGNIGGIRFPYFFLLMVCLLFFIPGISTLPPIDRDESRFAQASGQMLETGDFVRINFQDVPRNKKPIAIYWLQAASAAILGPEDHRSIWPYRIPSLIGAVFSVLLTFALGKRIFGEKSGFLGSVLTAASILLIVEAHLATTDAVLLASIIAAQGALSRFYLAKDQPQSGDTGAFYTFWVAQALGILVKGPVTPAISLLTAGALIFWDRDAAWLKRLRPLSGLAITAFLVSPWMIAIGIATKGTFFQQALVGDFFSKVASGQESHGFPPGFYLLLMPLTLWPASALAGVSLFRSWRLRSDPGVRFCLAWILPAWIMFELVPTKLPHYILPLYPALCLLVAHTVISSQEGRAANLDSTPVRICYSLCQLVCLFVGLGAIALPWFLDHRFDPVGIIPAVAGIGGAVLSTREFFKSRYTQALTVSIIATALIIGPLLQWVAPGISRIWLSKNISSAARQRAGEKVQLCSVGYEEPSLVFLLGTNTLLTTPQGAANFLKNNPASLALVDRSVEDAFKREIKNLGMNIKTAGAFNGFNYSKGKTMFLRLYAYDNIGDELQSK